MLILCTADGRLIHYQCVCRNIQVQNGNKSNYSFFFKTNIQHLFDAVILSLRVTRIIEFLCFALFLQKMLHLFAERKLKRLFRICIQDSRYFSLKQLM